MQIITWLLGSQNFGLPLHSCREVKENARLYPVPRARKYVAGLANLRGEPITVIDIERMINEDNSEIKRSHCTLVRIKNTEHNVALLVDTLSDIIDIPSEQMEAPPANFNEIKTALVAKVVQTEHGMIMILNPNELIKPRDHLIK